MTLGVACHTDVKIIIKFTANVLNQVNSVIESMYFFLPFLTNRISTQCHDVLQPQPLGLLQVPCDVILGLIAARHVEDGLQTTVVDCSVGNNHGGGFLVRSWVPRRMPCHINEERTTCCHAVKPGDEIDSSVGCAWREELQGEPPVPRVLPPPHLLPQSLVTLGIEDRSGAA